MSRVFAPDLVLRRDGAPIIVVEAKSLPIAAEFRNAVRLQMQAYAEQTGSPWSLLIDPERALLFRWLDTEKPYAEIPSREIVVAGGMADAPVVGERVLVGCAERWLRKLPDLPDFLRRYPGLVDLARALGSGNELEDERHYG